MLNNAHKNILQPYYITNRARLLTKRGEASARFQFKN